ncbi:hypothetical protein L2089_15860 [Paenibacillus hunanensis]|nr:hypothetical protein [Paenibacillus hunanensis]
MAVLLGMGYRIMFNLFFREYSLWIIRTIFTACIFMIFTIFVFAFGYYFVSILDLLNYIRMSKETTLTQLEIYNSLYLGDYINYKQMDFKNIWKYIKLSVDIFFNINAYSDFRGIGAILLILEKATAMLLFVFVGIISIVTQLDANRDKRNIIEIYLNRNWNILSITKLDIVKKKYHVILINSEREVKVIQTNSINKIKNFWDDFKFDWDDIDIKSVHLFAYLLKDRFKNLDYDLSLKLYLYARSKPLSDNELQEYYDFLRQDEVRKLIFNKKLRLDDDNNRISDAYFIVINLIQKYISPNNTVQNSATFSNDEVSSDEN